MSLETFVKYVRHYNVQKYLDDGCKDSHHGYYSVIMQKEIESVCVSGISNEEAPAHDAPGVADDPSQDPL